MNKYIKRCIEAHVKSVQWCDGTSEVGEVMKQETIKPA